nr:hypothetical protein Iba_chr10bCG7300 [Ipomoea batatas]
MVIQIFTVWLRSDTELCESDEHGGDAVSHHKRGDGTLRRVTRLELPSLQRTEAATIIAPPFFLLTRPSADGGWRFVEEVTSGSPWRLRREEHHLERFNLIGFTHKCKTVSSNPSLDGLRSSPPKAPSQLQLGLSWPQGGEGSCHIDRRYAHLKASPNSKAHIPHSVPFTDAIVRGDIFWNPTS